MIKEPVTPPVKAMLPVQLNASGLQWLAVGSNASVMRSLKALLRHDPELVVSVVAAEVNPEIKKLEALHPNLNILEKEFESSDLTGVNLMILSTGDAVRDAGIREEAQAQNVLVYETGNLDESNFVMTAPNIVQTQGKKGQRNFTSEVNWKRVASRLIFAFFLMVFGHLLISYLPLPSIQTVWTDLKPHFDRQFLFFILTGFLAQMVDGALSMGYGVTSATCLMSFGVNPVAMSAAIHTSEIFSTGISGYSHYKFGNVNKKLFRHLVIPGVLGAIIGAVLLVFLGEKAGKWLMPVVAVYAFFLGVKIILKAFQVQARPKKVKRVGWLAGAGGFLDSFGGGGWGPIVTSTLIAKGRSPKYTIGSVSLTEFFVTLASAVTFFIYAGVSHWNVVLGLLTGGALAAPLAARIAGRLPKKTMMLAVGIMVMIWCIRMVVKSIL
jgi:hypothetical protein